VPPNLTVVIWKNWTGWQNQEIVCNWSGLVGRASSRAVWLSFPKQFYFAVPTDNQIPGVVSLLYAVRICFNSPAAYCCLLRKADFVLG
jgi:hypothetical protein